MILLLSQVVLSYGMRFYLTLNKWVFILAMASTVFLIVVLAMSTREQFVANLNELVGPSLGVPDAYNAIIASGKEKGWGEAGFDLVADNVDVQLAVPAADRRSLFHRHRRRNQVRRKNRRPWACSAPCSSPRLAFVITVWLAYRVFGFEFLGTAVFNTLTANGGLTTPTDPSIALLTGILTKSPLITILTSLGLALWMWMWIPAMHTFGVRAVVAWAFDQVAPAPLATISEKYHTPIVAITVTTIVNLIFMALFVFTPWFSKIVILIEAAVLAWSVVLAAGMFFPYLGRAL